MSTMVAPAPATLTALRLSQGAIERIEYEADGRLWRLTTPYGVRVGATQAQTQGTPQGDAQ